MSNPQKTMTDLATVIGASRSNFNFSAVAANGFSLQNG
jgi:hypothetical protein